MKKRVDWFLLGMVAAALLAWVFPDPGAHGGALRPELLNKAGVALIFFLQGLLLSLAALSAGALLWRLHLLVQLATFLVCPLVGLVTLWAVGDRVSEGLAKGIFYLCALPSTVSSSVALTAAARGNVPAAVFNATTSSVIGVVLTPLWMGAVLEASGASLPLGSVVLDLVLWLLLPLALGQLLRPLWGPWALKHRKRLALVDRSTILLLIYTSFCDSVKSGVWRGTGAFELSFTLVFSCALLALLLVVTALSAERLGLPVEDRIVAMFCGSKKTLASGVPMARLMFGGDPHLALILVPIMIYHPLQLVVCGWLAARFSARPAATTAAPSAA